jgi:redox-sensitive bicupin YhaK (pirin superfamily)
MAVACSTGCSCSRTHAMEVSLLGGKPIGEPVVKLGPFVMNSKAEIVDAIEDYHAGRLGTIPAAAMDAASAGTA